MQFIMDVEDANRLYAMAKARRIAERETAPVGNQYIQCWVRDGVLKAQAKDVHGISQISFKVRCADDGEYFLAPPRKRFTKCIEVCVQDNEKETVYETDRGQLMPCLKSSLLTSEEIANYKSDFHQPEKREAQASYFVYPAVLARALSQYAGDDFRKVRLDYVPYGKGFGSLWIYAENGDRSSVYVETQGYKREI